MIMQARKAVGYAILICMSAALPVHADSMTFKKIGDAGNCRQLDCNSWVEATGDITENTPREFLSFLRENPNAPKILRFDSGGGNLQEGLVLGNLIRRLNFSTEADYCASSCAYAFMGGIDRQLVGRKKLGLHRFYTQRAVDSPTDVQFTGNDLDAVQKLMAGLMLFALKMDIDLRVVALAGESGPSEMRWLTTDEAIDLRMVFTPNKWMPWKIEGGDDGAPYVAVSETQDRKRSMQITCTAEGAYLALLADDEEPDRLNQCNAEGTEHPVLGVLVTSENVRIAPWREHGASMIFALPPAKLNFSDASLFSKNSVYPQVCIDSLGYYEGTTSRLEVMAKIAIARCAPYE